MPLEYTLAHEQGRYEEFKEELVHSTILDKEVLDNLISRFILTVDDREEIDSFPDQSTRNQKLLELLMHRPYNTFHVLVEVIKESEQQCNTLLERMTNVLDKGAYEQFKDELIHSTILDKEVLDRLISKCILTDDDKEEINQFLDQKSRNQKLLEILIHRPYNTFNIFVQAMKESNQQCNILLEKMTKFFDKDVTLQNVPHIDVITGIEPNAVKLIKCYKTIVHDVDVDAAGILDQLLAKMVISSEDNEEIRFEKNTTQEKSRRLLGKILRKTDASETFLEILKKDSCYEEISTNIEKNDITQNDLDLLSIGRRFRKRKRNGMTDSMIEKIQTWEMDDSLYIKTRATKHVLTCIYKHSCVSVLGPSGCGKTALVRHVALQMETNGYTIISVTDAKEIEKCFKMNRKTLFIVDDMCGNFTANQSRIEEWKKSMNEIKSILENGNCKLILTCRLQVFQDKGFKSLEIFKTCECDLRSDGLSLTSEEKKDMTSQYFKSHALGALQHLGKYECLPFLCKLFYVQRKNPHFNLKMFFDDPFSFYNQELPRMYNDCVEGRYKYCALLLLVIFNNKLEEKNLTGKDPKVEKIIEDIIEVCEMDPDLTGRKLKFQLDILTGTFVTYEEGIYKTIHDKLFDFLAFYFGTQKHITCIIDILIKHAEDIFVIERFAVANENKSTHYLIRISSDKLQMYMKRVFDDIVISCNVNNNIAQNENLENVKFRAMLRDYMGKLSKHDIIAFMEKANIDFLNKMFIMRKEDITYKVQDFHQEYKCFGIILPGDMLQQYIKKWFGALVETNSTNTLMENNRLLKCFTFRTTLKSYMKQLTTEQVDSIIQTGGKDFLNTMIVMADHDVKDFAENQNERFGIVILGDMVHNYIDRWFNDLTNYVGEELIEDDRISMSYFALPSFLCQNETKTWVLSEFVNKNRLLMNSAFRYALRTYIKQITNEKTASLIKIAKYSFLNEMFVMSQDDINDHTGNRCKWFGIVITDNLLQQYIEKYLNGLSNEFWLVNTIHMNRVFKNLKGYTALRTHFKQLNKEKIASLIQNSVHIFFNTMFVMKEEDIQYNQDRCFRIIIPDDLLQQYIKRWFDDLTKTIWVEYVIKENSLFLNVTFRNALRHYIRQLTTEETSSIIQTATHVCIDLMFVMSEEDINENSDIRSECFGIVIPDDLLQDYIKRWLGDLANDNYFVFTTSENRPLINVTFRSALCTYIRQLTTEEIAFNIQTANGQFLKNHFVMTEKDIKNNSVHRLDCVGIVIPEDLVQQFIERWFQFLTKTWSIKYFIRDSRLFKNVVFRTSLCDYMRQLSTEKIASLILNAEATFINTMFVLAEKDIKDNAKNRYECFGIIIPNDLLQQYIERWFECLTESDELEEFMDENRPIRNFIFRSSLCNHMRQLTPEKIASLIWNADRDFIRLMFVLEENDIKENSENRFECFGIVISGDLLQQYIERWFKDLTEAWSVEYFIREYRLLKNVIFRTSLCKYMRQIKTEKIASLIWKGKEDVLNMIFVMSEEDIKDTYENICECFGIVIPDVLLQQYTERVVECLTKNYYMLMKFIDKNRPFKNVKFRNALCNYMRQLNTEKITFLIWNTNEDFINTIFVLVEEDIKDNAAYRYECFGIVIPDDLLQQYIERWFQCLTTTNQLQTYIDDSRPMKNVTFRTALGNYMSQLNTDRIASLIWNADGDFINTMLVMSGEDIKDNFENLYECFGIVIPDELLQQYIERWFQCLTKTSDLQKFIDRSRLIKIDTFRTAMCKYMRQLNTEEVASLIWNSDGDFFNTMLVMSEEDIKDNSENLYECFGIVIRDDQLQSCIEICFTRLTITNEMEEYINKCRPLKNFTFRTALSNYMRQLNKEKIASLIWSSQGDFINSMFVMAEDDIKDNSENRYECLGIVIPDDLLTQYSDCWFQRLIETSELETFIDKNRPMKNVTFRIALTEYIRQLNTENIASLIWNADEDFIHTMFVMVEEDIKDNAENRYECFGIVIPDDLLQQYIERWFQCLTTTNQLETYIDDSRPMKSVTFRTALGNYMRQLNTDRIASLIWNADGDFINTMLVMSGEDIKDNSENLYECFGIVIPDELLQQYIERWLQRLTKTSDLQKFIDRSRLIKIDTFRTAMCKYMRQLNTEEVASLIWNSDGDFFNTMLVMSEEDIKDNSENLYECFGIVIRDDQLQSCIEICFTRLTITNEMEEYINKCRPLKNFTFRTALSNYMRQLNKEKIASLIWSSQGDFINSMFVMAEDDIKDNSENRYECFGIVIPDNLLQQYIESWFQRLTKTRELEAFIDQNRPIKNATFRTALCNYLRQINTKDKASLIWNANRDFINTMFVMAEDDIKGHAENRFECFGIILHDDLLQQYIERWFECLTATRELQKYIEKNRPSKNVTFCSALYNYMRQLNREKIASLIWNANEELINTIFVMVEDDIKDNAENRYECFGIVIPDDLLQSYIESCFTRLTKTHEIEKYIDTCRPIKNVTFRTALSNYMNQLNKEKIASLIWNSKSAFVNSMFVMAEDDIKDNSVNRYECFGIVIPDNLLQQYIESLFQRLTKTRELEAFINQNRPIKNATFRTALCNYLRQINTKDKASLIWNANRDFINTMFVMAEDDIKGHAENRFECFGIILHDDLLQQYIERWFECLTATRELQKYIEKNRPSKNVTFCSALYNYMMQLNREKIASLIWNANEDFINTMFVMVREDIKGNAENRYECFGIVIPDDLLQQYIQRLFGRLTKSVGLEKYIDKNRPIKNVTFRTALCNYMRHLNTKEIASLIWNANQDFINTMFVMTEDDMKDTAENQCFGIVLPGDLLQQYIERLFGGLTKTDSVEKCIDANRCLFNGTFRKVLQTYTKQLTRGKIGDLIRTGSTDFTNTMFVMTVDDIKDDDKNRKECFGIVIPDDLLDHYIERWFDDLAKTESAKQYIDVNRTFINSKFQANLDSYISGIDSERIEFLNREGRIDYLNKRRDMIKETSEIKS